MPCMRLTRKLLTYIPASNKIKSKTAFPLLIAVIAFPMTNGEKMPAGFPETIIDVKEEYVAEAMQLYGKLPYNEYKHYLSGIWKRFEQEFNVNKDNVFE